MNNAFFTEVSLNSYRRSNTDDFRWKGGGVSKGPDLKFTQVKYLEIYPYLEGITKIS